MSRYTEEGQRKVVRIINGSTYGVTIGGIYGRATKAKLEENNIFISGPHYQWQLLKTDAKLYHYITGKEIEI